MFSELRKSLDEAITYGCFESAGKLAREGLKKSRKHGLLGEAEYFRGQIEILNQNYDLAIMHFDRAIKYNPHDGAAFNDRALCMVELGAIDAALPFFDKGIKAEPDYATVYHNKGWLLNKIGRHKEAIECFNKALGLEPGRAVTYENLADALEGLCDYQGALAAYQKAIGLLKPDYSDIKEQIITRIKLLKDKISRISCE
ncbi:MAG: tetratricopeptide repeat protein [Candidatus Omnitrophota bacterium]